MFEVFRLVLSKHGALGSMGGDALQPPSRFGGERSMACVTGCVGDV